MHCRCVRSLDHLIKKKKKKTKTVTTTRTPPQTPRANAISCLQRAYAGIFNHAPEKKGEKKKNRFAPRNFDLNFSKLWYFRIDCSDAESLSSRSDASENKLSPPYSVHCAVCLQPVRSGDVLVQFHPFVSILFDSMQMCRVNRHSPAIEISQGKSYTVLRRHLSPLCSLVSTVVDWSYWCFHSLFSLCLFDCAQLVFVFFSFSFWLEQC